MVFAHIYTRISTKKCNSANKQLFECKKYCRHNKLSVKSVNQHVMSSRNMSNKKMLNSIVDKMKKGDILIIYSICRFSRNVYEGLDLLNKMDNKNIKIFSIDDNIGYKNMFDRYKFRDILNHSELEIDKLSHRVKNWNYHKYDHKRAAAFDKL